MTNEVIQGNERGTYSRARYVLCQRNAGLPTGREPYGNGALVVVRAGESPAHGEGGQVVFDGIRQGGLQNARRRNCTERHP